MGVGGGGSMVYAIQIPGHHWPHTETLGKCSIHSRGKRTLSARHALNTAQNLAQTSTSSVRTALLRKTFNF